VQNRLGLGSASQDFIDVSKRSSNYFLGQVLTKSLGFLLIPLYTRFLVPADYGLLAMVTSFSSVAGVFYTVGLRGSFSRFYWDYKDDRQELGEFFTTVLSFVAIVSILCSVILLGFGRSFFAVVMRDVPFDPYIKMGILLALFGVFPPFWTTLCRVREKSLTYVIFTTASFLLTTVLSIYFIVFLKEGALGRLRGQVCAQGAFAVLALLLLGRELVPRVSLQKLRAALKYGLPLIPHNLSGWIMSLLDRLVLGGYQGLSSVGVYNIGYALGGVMGMIAMAFNLAYSPYFMKKLTEQGEKARTTIARVATLWTTVMVLPALSIGTFSWEIVHLMTPAAYHDAWKVVPIITLAFLCQGMYFMSVAPLFYNKKFTRYVPVGSLAGGGINILGNFLLIPRYGMMGAAWATAVSYLVMFIIAHLLGKKAYSVPYEYAKIGTTLAIGAVLFGITFGIGQLGFAWWARGLLKLATVFTYFPLLLLCKVFEWQRVKQLIGEVSPWKGKGRKSEDEHGENDV